MRASWLLLFACAAFARPDGARAGDIIRRCEGPDGVTIYTDRECSALGAVDRKLDLEAAPRATPPGVATPEAPAPLLRTDCARTADTLLFDLRRHVESRNVNRVAGLYHWVGVGTGASRHVMDRLQRLVEQPPASIEFVYPDVAPVHDDPSAFPRGTPVEDPIGLRLQRADLELEPAQDLRLVRHAACWWFAF